MQAILYTSNTDSTARYAQMLGQRLDLPVYSAKEAAKALPRGAQVLYLGWLMAGGIKGYKSAARRYAVRAVCAVGMSVTGARTDEVRAQNAVPQDVPLFTLQGAYDITKLRGPYRLLMSRMGPMLAKSLLEKPDRTPEEDDMLALLQNNGDRVRPENLAAVLDWCAAQREEH